jgi:CheY-like chemotaxis protein
VRILVIDDERSFDNVADYAEHTFVYARTESEGVEQLERSHFDALWLDGHLGGIEPAFNNGARVASWLRRNRNRFAHLVVKIITTDERIGRKMLATLEDARLDVALTTIGHEWNRRHGR